MKRLWRLVLFAACLEGATALLAHAEDCPVKPDAGANVRRYSGPYRNGAYDFATKIPDGYVGLDSGDAGHQRGFLIVLPKGGGTLSVSGDVNSLDDLTARAAAEFNLKVLRKRTEHVLAPVYLPQRLAGRPAELLSAQFRCPHDETRYAYLSLSALSPDSRFVYSLEWEGPLREAQAARKILQQLKSFWKFLPSA